MLLAVACGRDNDVILDEVKKEEIKPLKDFTLEKAEITIKKGEIGRIKILSGNGDYDYNSNQVAIISISADKQYVEIRGLLAGGKTESTITDTKIKKSIRISVDVID